MCDDFNPNHACLFQHLVQYSSHTLRHIMPASTIPGTVSSPPARIDPSAPGTIIRTAFALEAALNVVGGTCMILYPTTFLSFLAADPSHNVTPAVTALFQWFGALTLGLTPQLLLALPNTEGALLSRPTVYWTLLAGEAGLVPLMAWQMRCAGAVTALGVVAQKTLNQDSNGLGVGASLSNGLSRNGLLGSAAILAATSVWRLWVLLVKPEWMGRYDSIQKKQR